MWGGNSKAFLHVVKVYGGLCMYNCFVEICGS